ncbi:uncharacterized protein TrAFT101_007337 [Trichoderma asperellum]|uniref:uncharacterized protein n=1 Tax=Trichoderma asperellum TaxID=101201 RepID=UPI003322A11E|nr:hypothetical protein TrAFT101_007337 [Trichoderma asperellum]
MGLKQFNQDLAASRAISISAAVSNIRRGDSDGEAVFTWSSSNDVATTLDVQVLVLDVDSYPKSSSVMTFTESDHSAVDVSSILERLSPSLANKNIETIIRTVAEKLSAKLEPANDAPGVTDSDSMSDFDDYDEAGYDDNFDGDSFLPASSKELSSRHIEAAIFIRQLKRDLRIVQSAGISVGVFPRRPLRDAEFYSLSLRVMKLGIPEHALEAWGLKNEEYLVLLCRFAPHYPTISEIWNTTFEEWKPQFRFGKCSRPKPSVETSRLAFTKPFDGTADNRESADENGKRSDVKGASGGFVPLYMSNSINMLMNGDFLKLLHMRRSDGLSWDRAIRRQKLLTKEGYHILQQDDPLKDDTSDNSVFDNAMPSLSHDYALDDEEKLNLPMVAMQFALRRLVRCTKYCMVCHQRLEDEFEALKPYVCASPLCTYQFVTLGLGASIEHEIIHNPYVVDILISFFASALAHPKSMRQYPTGLNLKSVDTGSKANPSQHSVAEACFFERSIRFDPTDYSKHRSIKAGDTILVVIDGLEPSPTAFILNGNLERHVCKVTNTVAGICSFEIVTTMTGPPNVLTLPEEECPTQVSNPTKEWVKVLVFQYSNDVDNLDASERSTALSLMLRGIPPVLDMRTYLLNNPSKRLTSWGRIDKNALTLLQWIISSNTSLILQDDAVPTLADSSKSDNLKKAEALNPNKVQGIPVHWMQFRFLQGTPERERLFMKELAAVSQSKSPESQFPSIFTWHGSPLRNWHSIIRTGLDFETISFGRSFGNGVYMSKEFLVSMHYSGKVSSPQKSTGPRAENYWPNSVLRPSSAISICEVVNQTKEFVSVEPHYVVNKIEWIQCRYLFVAVDPAPEAMKQPFPMKPTNACVGYISQCPSNQLAVRGTPVHIPLSAVPLNRKGFGQSFEQFKNQEILISKTKDASTPEIMDTLTYKTKETPRIKETPTETLDSDHGETDHELLLDSEDEAIDATTARYIKRRNSSTDSIRRTKLKSAAYMSGGDSISKFKTKFLPGSLNLHTLPRLPDPSWASSPVALRSLNRAIKELHQIQSSSSEDIASLGWYIDFNNLSNVFHWIVELHSFDLELPLAQDMEKNGCTSIVLEFRFGANFPFSPPFVRVIRPRFLPFARGGGGHVTVGGAICSEILTNSGWSAAMAIEKVFIQIRLGLTELDPPARLDKTNGMNNTRDYAIGEAVDAYQRAARAHGWLVPEDLQQIGYAWVTNDD